MGISNQEQKVLRCRSRVSDGENAFPDLVVAPGTHDHAQHILRSRDPPMIAVENSGRGECGVLCIGKGVQMNADRIKNAHIVGGKDEIWTRGIRDALCDFLEQEVAKGASWAIQLTSQLRHGGDGDNNLRAWSTRMRKPGTFVDVIFMQAAAYFFHCRIFVYGIHIMQHPMQFGPELDRADLPTISILHTTSEAGRYRGGALIHFMLIVEKEQEKQSVCGSSAQKAGWFVIQNGVPVVSVTSPLTPGSTS